MALVVKNWPAKAGDVRDLWVQSLGWEDPLEEGMATQSSILAWRTQWTEEPGGLQIIGSQRVGHNGSNLACTRWFPLTAEVWWALMMIQEQLVIHSLGSSLTRDSTSLVRPQLSPCSQQALPHLGCWAFHQTLLVSEVCYRLCYLKLFLEHWFTSCHVTATYL